MILPLFLSFAALSAFHPFRTPTTAPPRATLSSTVPGPVWSVAFSPDGKVLAVGGYRFVRLYETETGKRIAAYAVPGEAVRSVAFSPDGKALAVGTGVPGHSGMAFVLDPATGTVRRQIKGHADTVEAVAFFRNTLLTAADDERILITDTTTGQTVGKLTEHNGRCLAVGIPVTFQEDMGGEVFGTGGADHMFKVWDAKARRVVVNFDQCASPVWAVAPRPPHAGRFVVGSGDGRLRYFVVYRDKNGKPDEQGVQPRGGHQEGQSDAHEGGVYAVAVAPSDGFVVSGGADRRTVLWNTGGGPRATFSEAEGDIWGVAVSPDGKRIASASLDGKARVYDTEKLKLVYTLDAGGVYVPPPIKIDPALVARLPKRFEAGVGLTAAYFNNRAGSGRPAVIRTDATVDFDWNSQPPGPGVQREDLFVRWDGFVEAPVTGEYRFITRSDDGVRLTVNGRTVVDAWVDRAPAEDRTEPIRLKAGQRVPIRMEYYQGNGGAEARLSWEYSGTAYIESIRQTVNQARQAIPTKYLYPVPESKAVKPTPARVASGRAAQ
ncbi:MAG: PA14 domain-containing protein [Capsulimonadales bacterium]|nr:PA14 domain-containing protein [Capsulimonadales bacterium]